MTVKPFGMTDSDKHQELFDPLNPVRICYWGMNKFGFALGFSQQVARGKFFGGVFSRRVHVVEWVGGNIHIGSATMDKFVTCFRKVYGMPPNVSVGALTNPRS